jgi:hypothetical protein
MTKFIIQSVINQKLLELNRRKKQKINRIESNYDTARVMNQKIVDERRENCYGLYPLVGWLVGWLVGQSVGWLVNPLVGWSILWLVGQSSGLLRKARGQGGNGAPI